MKDFQLRVWEWALMCFPRRIVVDRQERDSRFIEEALELVQSCGTSKETVLAIVDYVYSRPVGDRGQEVGGTAVTLALLCQVYGLDMAQEALRELTRISQDEIILKIRAKQAGKPAAIRGNG